MRFRLKIDENHKPIVARLSGHAPGLLLLVRDAIRQGNEPGASDWTKACAAYMARSHAISLVRFVRDGI